MCCGEGITEFISLKCANALLSNNIYKTKINKYLRTVPRKENYISIKKSILTMMLFNLMTIHIISFHYCFYVLNEKLEVRNSGIGLGNVTY